MRRSSDTDLPHLTAAGDDDADLRLVLERRFQVVDAGKALVALGPGGDAGDDADRSERHTDRVSQGGLAVNSAWRSSGRNCH